MRRWFSITAICALLASTAMPLVAASCPHAKMAMACHRTEHAQAQGHQHHCDEMAKEQNDPGSSETRIQSALQQNCPMDCCSASQRTSAVALSAVFSTAALPLAGHDASFINPVFSTSGFSSHTDRGPPTA